MFCVSVDFEIKSEWVERFIQRAGEQAETSLCVEAGCRIFEVWLSSENATRIHLHEVYDDAAAFAKHLASDHFQAFDSDTADMVLDKTVTSWDRKV